MAYLIQNKHKSATIRNYVSAIKAVLQEDKVKISEDHFLLSSLTRACKLKNDQVKAHLPIQGDFLALILNEMAKMFDQKPYLMKMYSAMAIAAYFGMLRIGEIAQSEHAVGVLDVSVATNKKKIMFVLRSSKTHNKGDHPQIIKLVRHAADRFGKKKGQAHFPEKLICPYEALRQFIAVRPKYHSILEQFFVFGDRSYVKPVQFRIVLKSAIKNVGLDEKLYDTHSLRIGQTVDLLKLGFSVETIKKLGH